tara:strand:+ start:10680 stop:10913 length:234 start_codon:yes stop_codon:yes gene_type:complete
MTIEPQQLPEIELLFTPAEVTRLGWDGFGQIVGIMFGMIPVWMWLGIPIILVLFGEKIIPLILRWAWRYLTRSSLLS